jgi:uncharacterized membrane protein YccC
VAIAAYTPGTAPFALGQAFFTVTVVVLFNLLMPAGWQVGLIRVEDVGLGCGVSLLVGALFWPRGAAAVLGDNLADALRAGARYLEQATRWALDLGRRRPSRASQAIAAGARLDDSVRGFLSEQGTKLMPKAELWVLVMAAQRIRLTAHSLSTLPEAHRSRPRGHAGDPEETAEPAGSRPSYAVLAGFYDEIASQVARPGHRPAMLTEIPVPATLTAPDREPPRPDPELLWIQLHLEQLTKHAIALSGPAARLARIRDTPWWRRRERVA